MDTATDIGTATQAAIDDADIDTDIGMVKDILTQKQTHRCRL